MFTGRDKNLQLALVFSKPVYNSHEPIICKAILSYIGEEAFFDFYSGKPVIMFAIEGDRYFNGQKDLLQKGLYSCTIKKNYPLEYPFKKYKGEPL
jgi:hypothetical protein